MSVFEINQLGRDDDKLDPSAYDLHPRRPVMPTMLEGCNHDGHMVLLNPREIVEVYAGGTKGYAYWCNVKTTSGQVHRFTGPSAEKVYEALKNADLG